MNLDPRDRRSLSRHQEIPPPLENEPTDKGIAIVPEPDGIRLKNLTGDNEHGDTLLISYETSKGWKRVEIDYQEQNKGMFLFTGDRPRKVVVVKKEDLKKAKSADRVRVSVYPMRDDNAWSRARNDGYQDNSLFNYGHPFSPFNPLNPFSIFYDHSNLCPTPSDSGSLDSPVFGEPPHAPSGLFDNPFAAPDLEKPESPLFGDSQIFDASPMGEAKIPDADPMGTASWGDQVAEPAAY